MSIISIDTEKLLESPFNPRRIRKDDAGILELAESIKVHGQLQPGVVRIYPGQPHLYEVLAGNRRLVAARAAGMQTYDARVVDVDDRTALEMVVTENLQREDLKPLEEARAIKALATDGHTLEETARVLGKTVNWIARRIQLLDLIPELVEATENPDNVMSLWTIGMLEDVASLPVETQKALLDLSDWRFPQSASALATWIATEQRLLKKAAWDLDDEALLPDAGACANCLKRTGAQPELFGGESGDRCMDVGCWRRKVAALQARRVSLLRDKFPNLVLVKGDHERFDDTALVDQASSALSSWEYQKVKKATPGAVPALIMVGKGAGNQIWIAPDKSSSSKTQKAITKSAVAEDPKAQLKEKELALEKRRASLCVKMFAERLGAMSVTDLSPQPSDGMLIALAANVGTRDKTWDIPKAVKGYESAIGNPDKSRYDLWEQIVAVIVQNLQVHDGAHALICMKRIDALVRILPLRSLAQAAWDEAEAEIPETKSILALRDEIRASSKKVKTDRKAKGAA